MNIEVDALLSRLHSSTTKKEGVTRSPDEFYVNPAMMDIPVEVEGIGRIGLTMEGALRVNSEQLLKISQMRIGKYETCSLENGSFLIIPPKNK